MAGLAGPHRRQVPYEIKGLTAGERMGAVGVPDGPAVSLEVSTRPKWPVGMSCASQ